jgi:hypothetical protein
MVVENYGCDRSHFHVELGGIAYCVPNQSPTVASDQKRVINVT